MLTSRSNLIPGKYAVIYRNVIKFKDCHKSTDLMNARVFISLLTIFLILIITKEVCFIDKKNWRLLV